KARVALVAGPPSLAALHEPHDQRGAENGEDDPAPAPEEQPADKAANDRPDDAHEDRHRDAHGVRPRDDEAAEGADYETAEDDPDDEQNHGFSLLLATSLTRQRDRSRIRQALGGSTLHLACGVAAGGPSAAPQ